MHSFNFSIFIGEGKDISSELLHLTQEEPGLRFRFFPTGLLLIQGKSKRSLEEFLSSLFRLGLLNWELSIGCDESGKGEHLGGISLACLAVLSFKGLAQLIREGVKDSKKLKAHKIRKIALSLKKFAEENPYDLYYRELSLGVSHYNELYDQIGNQAKLISRLYVELLGDLPDYLFSLFQSRFGYSPRIVIDGHRLKYIETTYYRGSELIFLPKAERIKSVAAASILARDSYLRNISLNLSERLGREIPYGELRGITSEILKKLQKRHFSKR